MYGRPGLKWVVLGETPREAIDYVVRVCEKRYNPITSDNNFELIRPNLDKININDRKEFPVRKNGRYCGKLIAQYLGKAVDKSTFELKTAQRFWVYFNFMSKEQSFRERDSVYSMQQQKGLKKAF